MTHREGAEMPLIWTLLSIQAHLSSVQRLPLVTLPISFRLPTAHLLSTFVHVPLLSRVFADLSETSPPLSVWSASYPIPSPVYISLPYSLKITVKSNDVQNNISLLTVPLWNSCPPYFWNPLQLWEFGVPPIQTCDSSPYPTVAGWAFFHQSLKLY